MKSKPFSFALLLGVAAVLPPARADDTAQLGQIEVVAPGPLPGIGLPLDEVPTNVQTANAGDLRQDHDLDLSHFLDADFSGISVSESQGNPFQPDVDYHGFTASPLLGTPEGISVYLDGVRVNESFGDIVNWDLIPESALEGVMLVPGSDPVYGLNTLGGALALRTKDGRDSPGTEVEASAGSFGRQDVSATTGGTVGDHWDYFGTARFFDENGWREESPTRISQVFGKLGWHGDKSSLHLSYTRVDSNMIGNGTTPDSLLAQDYRAIYTAPDDTRDHMDFLNLTGESALNSDLFLSGDVYYRRTMSFEQNGDANDDNYLDSDGGFTPPTGVTPPDCAGLPLGGTTRDDMALDAYCADGIFRLSKLIQRSLGSGLQLTEIHDLAGLENQAVLGVSYDGSDDSYVQTFQYGNLNVLQSADVGMAGPPQIVNDISGTTDIAGIYATDTLSPNKLVHITGSLRYNRDDVTLGGYSVDTSLDDFGDGGFNSQLPIVGDHSFERLNPALGVTLTPSSRVTLYGQYDEGSRAPTVIELGCSNPAVPCGLPNDFSSDPDLKQVVARTFEVGARGLWGTDTHWNADVFHTRNSDDIQFISSAASNAEGYFANVGDTLREGVDLGLSGQVDALRWRVNASWLRALYESQFIESDEDSNSSSDANGAIVVQPGDHIPLTPERTARAALDYAVTPTWRVGMEALYSGGSFLHGDENNADVAATFNGQGEFVEGSGYIGGYTVLNASTDWQVNSHWDVFLRVDNLLNRRYATAGFLSDNVYRGDKVFRANGVKTNEDEVVPGEPRAAWVGLQYRW
ncbi:MAG TPA: TonB-dependent receptor [Gammaproteobacteria bacterium]